MTRHRGFTVFDVETTGLSAKHGHRIIEIGIVRLDEDLDVIEKWETLINPNRDIGKQEIHGIESRDLLNAPSFEDIAADIWHRFDGAVPVAHNHPNRRDLPSHQDKTLTRALVLGTQTVEISVIEHLIVAREAVFSFRKEGLL